MIKSGTCGFALADKLPATVAVAAVFASAALADVAVELGGEFGAAEANGPAVTVVTAAVGAGVACTTFDNERSAVFPPPAAGGVVAS